jgi:glycosyltransferase involved in cell wall biosynthesis
MYEAGNPKSLANKLRALLTSRERRAAVGEELKRRVREEHGLDAFAIKLARVLHEPRGPSVLKPLDLAT